jgi:hypothetical protein
MKPDGQPPVAHDVGGKAAHGSPACAARGPTNTANNSTIASQVHEPGLKRRGARSAPDLSAVISMEHLLHPVAARQRNFSACH